MRTLKPIMVLVAILLGVQAMPQQQKCGSVLDLENVKRNNPERYKRFTELEKLTKNYIDSMPAARLVNNNSTIIIPVVVHVLHQGEAVGTGRNISDAQIQSQIDVLNEDFRRLNADRVNTPAAFQGVAADVNIEFRLACTDPNGNATNGITRTLAGQASFDPNGNINPDGSYNEWDTRIKYTAQGGRDAWLTYRYLNIWVCELDGTLLGYAQFPADYFAKYDTDGIVVDFETFGRIGNLLPNNQDGRVAVHEVGHWLNLRHIWGDAVCGDDFVNDTPPQAWFNTNCPGFPRVSGCGNGPNGDMFMNYMDYTNDNCKNLFTAGQAARMRAIFFGRGGPRQTFIDQYFFVNPRNAICSTGVVSVTNPGCEAVTWTILSGPASITSGQGTNAVTLQRTGNGTVVIQASTGNFIDEEEIIMGADPLTVIGPYDPQQHTIMGVACLGETYYFIPSDPNNNPNPTYTWTLFPPPGSSNFPTLYSGSQVYMTFQELGYHTVRVSTTTPCGTTYTDRIIDVQECLNGRFSIATSPNPAIAYLSVKLEEHLARTANENEAVTIELYNFYTGGQQKQWRFNTSLRQFRLNIQELPKGLYVLRVTKGKHTQTAKVMIGNK